MSPRAESNPQSTAIVIDEDPSVRQLVRRTLDGVGYGVLDAADADRGLRLVEEHADQLEVVLVDAESERIGGREMAAVFGHYGPGLAVVGMSGRRTPSERAAPGTAAPFTSVLRKPFADAELLTAVEAAVARAGRPVQLLSRRADLTAAARALRAIRGGSLQSRSGPPQPPACPVCGSGTVVPIWYGPARLEVMQAYAAGRISLGGVPERPGAPHWYCRACDYRWRAERSG
ncbi:MAG TPA: response regulator [Gemmatimonadales bacterium]|nr:response regulator [Gemmatimonadales bacterium]